MGMYIGNSPSLRNGLECPRHNTSVFKITNLGNNVSIAIVINCKTDGQRGDTYQLNTIYNESYKC